jgi:hypothetical protein
MYNKLLGCNDICVLIESNNQEVIQDLDNMFGSYYKDISLPKFVIRYIEGILPNKYHYFDNERGDTTYNYLVMDGNCLTVYFDKYTSYKKQFNKRIFTTSFIKLFQQYGYTIIHGASAEKNNNAVIITGNKGAGKQPP